MKCLPRDQFLPEDHLNELICRLGYGIFREPVSLPCQHVFCKQCIEGDNDGKGHGNCVVCKEPWSKEQLKPQLEVSELINTSIVVCPLNCKWKGQYQNLEKHKKSECPNALVACQSGCNQTFPRQYFASHEAECTMKKADCTYCKKSVLIKEMPMHQLYCPDREIACPVCEGKLKLFEIEIHSKNMHVSTPVCMFSFAGCYFAAKPGGLSLEAHYKESMDAHIDMLCNTVTLLRERVEKLEHDYPEEKRVSLRTTAMNGTKSVVYTISTPIPAGPKPYSNVKWSTGSAKVVGNKKAGWSFYLSNTIIKGNFAARVKILSLGGDSNTWKICLGLFNSDRHQIGSWDKYKNGWGYILGNGNMIHESPAVGYGQSYAIGDIITIEHKNRTIVFYKNNISQGAAYTNIPGPFYLAAALSDIGHSIEILDVTELS